jgi:hypothetical protein
MSHWRILGELLQARSREEIVVQSLEGWNPWSGGFWIRVAESDIVVPHPKDMSRLCHVHTYEAPDGVGPKKFAALSDEVWYFWVPASPSAKGAFEAVEPKYEGHWRASRDETSDLPWPTPEHGWAERSAFLAKLAMIELDAERVVYRGLSLCRICGRVNGHVAFRMMEWEWPAGYRHYLSHHDVRPTQQFEAFVLGWNADALAISDKDEP